MAVDLILASPLDTAHPVDLTFGAEAGGGTSTQTGTAALVAPLPGLTAAGVYLNNVSRGPTAGASSHWQAGTARAAQPVAGWTQAARISQQEQAPWGAATPLHQAATSPMRDQQRVDGNRSVPWQASQALQRAAGLPWQDMQPVRRAAAAPFQAAAPLQQQAASPWQERGRHIRPATLAAWQETQRILRQMSSRYGSGSRAVLGLRAPHQDARHPPPGHSTTTPPPPPPSPCYTPPAGDRVDLLLITPWMPSTTLLLRCRDFDLPAGSVIPYQRTYMAVHSITVVRLPDLTPVPITEATISTDADSYCWSLNATGGADLLDLLAPSAGEPAQLRITVDGMSWVFAAEQLARRRAFGQTRVTVTGRSVTALIGAPYRAETSYANTADRLAEQLVTQALDLTGIGHDWQLTDWLVPAGAWSHFGTPLAAVLRVAESVGAVVQSDRTAPTLRLLPRYPVLPWQWSSAGVAPDVQLPLASIISDGWERRDAPPYNRAIVAGQNQGVVGIVTRTGTAGDLAAPLITDALITAADAARQRAEAILGAAGAQSLVSLDLPVLTGGTLPGVLGVNQLVEIVEPAETWRGMVRSVSLKVGWPKVRQSVTLERHYA